MKEHTSQREAAWDGMIATRLESWVSPENKLISPEVLIQSTISQEALRKQFYVDCLFYPDGHGKVELPSPPSFYPLTGGPDYWLPDALKRNAAQYRVAPQRDTVDEAECIVLEWPKRDRIWLDPAMNYAIRRRDFRRPDGVMRDRLFLREWEQVTEGVRLPRLIVREYYCNPIQDPKELQNQISGVHTLEVKHWKIGLLPDEQFRLQIPEGARVSDLVRDVYYEVVRPGDDPITRAEAEVRRQLRGGSTWIWVVGITAAVGAIAAVGILVYRRR